MSDRKQNKTGEKETQEILFGEFMDVIRTLMGPEGCPWDRQQTHESLKRYLIEEAYEVCEAVDSGSSEALADELGVFSAIRGQGLLIGAVLAEPWHGQAGRVMQLAQQQGLLVLQAGADGVTEDPLSRLAMSNGAHAAMALALARMAPRLIVLGGGGYNPWSVARCWVRIWGALNGRAMPDRLPSEAAAVLEALEWRGRAAGRAPPVDWKTTLVDPPRPGEVGPELVARVEALRARLRGLAVQMAALRQRAAVSETSLSAAR